MIICIGPFCIPVVWGLPFFAALFMSLRAWLTNIIFGEKKENVLLPEASQLVSVQHITNAKELYALEASGAPIIIDFTATWCGPCQKIAPFFAELSSRFATVRFVKVDVDELSEVSEEFKVTAMPTFVAVKDGKEVARVVGANKVDLEAAIVKLTL